MRRLSGSVWLVGVFWAGGAGLGLQQTAAAADFSAIIDGLRKGKPNLVRQGFPAATASSQDVTQSETAWEIEWDITNPSNGTGLPNTKPASVLVIRSAKFMFKDSGANVRWFTVLRNLELGEILVPYAQLDPVFLDVSDHGFRIIPARKEYLGPACVLPGEILDSADPRMKGKVLKEVHDDGLRWLNNKHKSRRGEKMLLWAIFDGDNYRYIIEYGFCDDGSMTVRLGATAHNYFNKQKDGRDAHLHVGSWRWDPELSESGEPGVGGANQNQVLLVRRVPRTATPNGTFRIDVAPFSANGDGQATEGFADWKAEEFTMLRVQSKVRKNGSKDPQFTAFDVVPMRTGTVRSYPGKFAFANHDFWVTLKRPEHKWFHNVPQYAGRSKPLDNAAITVWHNSASLHVPRGEDYGADGVSSGQGAAITTWTGFMLKPVNLFDSTPLYR